MIPTSAGDQQHRRLRAALLRQRSIRAFCQHPGAGTQRLHRDPQAIILARGRQREGVHRGPCPGREKLPAEELPGLRCELVQMPSVEHHADDAVSLSNHLVHLEAVPDLLLERCQEPVPQHQEKGRGIEQAPRDLHGAVAGEVRTGKLVAERQGRGKVGGQVQSMPLLIRERASDRPRGYDPDAKEEQGANSRRCQSRQRQQRAQRDRYACSERVHPGLGRRDSMER